jgi:Type IV secretion system proteins
MTRRAMTSRQELRARAQGTAGLQALAQQSVESIEARMASLREFFDGIEGSGDIQEAQAVTARLALENNFINAQNAQAQQLMVLAKAQEQATQQRVEQWHRESAEEVVRATSGVPLP